MNYNKSDLIDAGFQDCPALDIIYQHGLEMIHSGRVKSLSYLIKQLKREFPEHHAVLKMRSEPATLELLVTIGAVTLVSGGAGGAGGAGAYVPSAYGSMQVYVGGKMATTVVGELGAGFILTTGTAGYIDGYTGVGLPVDSLGHMGKAYEVGQAVGTLSSHLKSTAKSSSGKKS